jgi:O-antigen ligase
LIPDKSISGEGGRNAAFPFFVLFAAAVLLFGGSVQSPLFALRAAGFGWGLLVLLRRRNEEIRTGPYPLVVAGLVVLAVGHSFSSVYFWVSLQHAINIALGAALLAWAATVYGTRLKDRWDATLLLAGGLGVLQIGAAVWQRSAAGNLRPRGTLENPTYLAEFLVVTGTLFLAGFLGRRAKGRRRWMDLGAAVAFIAAALLLTASRGVLVALVPALGLLLAWRYGWKKGGLLLAGAAVPALAVLGWRAVARFSFPDVYNFGRWSIWRSAALTFLENPFGVGLGGFKYFWFATQSPFPDAFRHYGKDASTAHNEYLEVLSGLGAVGLVVFLAVLLAPFAMAVRKRREIPEEKRWIAAGAAAGLLLSGIHAVFNSTLHNFGIVFTDAILLGAFLSCLPPGSATERRLAVPAWGKWLGMSSCAVLLLLSLCTWLGTTACDRGDAKARAGKFRDAETMFRAAAALDPFRASIPDSLAALAQRGYLEEKKRGGDPSRAQILLAEAIRREEKAVALCPMEQRYLLRLSSLAFERYGLTGRPDDVEAAFRPLGKILSVNPYSVEALWQRASMAAALGDIDRAAADVKAAVSVEPNFCRGYGKLADIMRTVDPSEAAAWAGKDAACRRKASALPRDEFWAWFVEDAGAR